MIINERYQQDGVSRLPSEYQEVEYVENTSTSYINTEYESADITEVELSFYLVSKRTWSNIYGASARTDNVGYGIQLSHSNTLKIAYKGQTSDGAALTAGDYNMRAIFKDGEQKLYVNDNLVISSNKINANSIPNVSFFGVYYGGRYLKLSETALARIRSIKLYNSDGLLADYVSCYRKSDNVIGFYDLCGSVCSLTDSPFFINYGTGTFSKGADVGGSLQFANMQVLTGN